MSAFQGNCPVVDLKVLLPTRDVVTVKVKRNSSSHDVFQMVASAVGLSRESSDFFALYEIVEHNFGEYWTRIKKRKVLTDTFLIFRKKSPTE